MSSIQNILILILAILSFSYSLDISENHYDEKYADIKCFFSLLVAIIFTTYLALILIRIEVSSVK